MCRLRAAKRDQLERETVLLAEPKTGIRVEIRPGERRKKGLNRRSLPRRSGLLWSAQLLLENVLVAARFRLLNQINLNRMYTPMNCSLQLSKPVWSHPSNLNSFVDENDLKARSRPERGKCRRSRDAKVTKVKPMGGSSPYTRDGLCFWVLFFLEGRSTWSNGNPPFIDPSTIEQPHRCGFPY